MASSSDSNEGGDFDNPPSKRQRLNTNCKLKHYCNSNSNCTVTMQSTTNGHQNNHHNCDTGDKNGNGQTCEKRLSPSMSHFSYLKNNLFENNGKSMTTKRTFTHAQRDILRIIGQHLKNLGLP